ncbi:MAG: sulfite exporter TauE/SafE family protein [Gammaproteobacteria bacterium]|nr:sulfite exporter TauE/SafE family protein [Gammaproteobacteria bacterium]
MFTILILGLLVGIILGLTGAGGGILAIPALVFSQGWSVSEAAPIGLLAVTGAAIVGAVEGFIRKLVRYRAALWISIVGIPMTPLGLLVAHVLPSRWLMISFSGTMLIVAIRLLRPNANNEQYHPCHINPDTGRLYWTTKTVVILGGVGVLTGFLTGLLGVGGGFVLVPALRKATNISMHGIVATSLFIIALVGSGGIISSLIQGHIFPLTVAIPFIVACMVGMFGGRKLIHHFKAQTVQQFFAFLVIAVSIMMFFRALQIDL